MADKSAAAQLLANKLTDKYRQNFNSMAQWNEQDLPKKPTLSIDSQKYHQSLANTGNSIEDTMAGWLGIKPEDIAWARELGKSYGDNQEYYGRGDAARHAALGWLASQSESPNLAYAGIMAREFDPVDLFTTKDTMTDISNNNIGYDIEARDRQEAENIIRQKITAGDLDFLNKGSKEAYR